MLNPLKSTVLRHIAPVACLAAGAIGGIWLGFSLSQWTWGGLEVWVAKRPEEAAGWAAFGAATAGVLEVAAIALKRLMPRRRPVGSGSTGARSAPAPQGENTSDTSRRRRERTGKVSLQQALAGADKAALRA
jgi:hypothetical protein